jgi:hypothetical protein
LCQKLVIRPKKEILQRKHGEKNITRAQITKKGRLLQRNRKELKEIKKTLRLLIEGVTEFIPSNKIESLKESAVELQNSL